MPVSMDPIDEDWSGVKPKKKHNKFKTQPSQPLSAMIDEEKRHIPRPKSRDDAKRPMNKTDASPKKAGTYSCMYACMSVCVYACTHSHLSFINQLKQCLASAPSSKITYDSLGRPIPVMVCMQANPLTPKPFIYNP